MNKVDNLDEIKHIKKIHKETDSRKNRKSE